MFPRTKATLAGLLVSGGLMWWPATSQAGFFSELQSAVAATNLPATTGAAAPAAGSLSSLAESQVVDGLKTALSQGVAAGAGELGHPGGFLTNAAVRIPLPGKLQAVDRALQLAGQSQLADEFVASMNHAAEQAVPAAAGVFGDAIQHMSVADAKSIVSGPPDAGTQYFRSSSQDALYQRIYPLVQQCMGQTGVTAKYEAMMSKFSSLQSFGSLFGGGAAAAPLGAADLNAYVTHGAMNGLFQMVAVEEARIRSNPAACASGLLQTVFGAAH